MTKEELEKNWVKRGYSFGIGNIKINDGIKNAAHDDQDELVVMVNGDLKVTIDDVTFFPDRDKEFLIPARSKHSLKNIGAVDSVIYFGYKKTGN